MDLLKKIRFNLVLRKIQAFIWDLDGTLYFNKELIDNLREEYLHFFSDGKRNRLSLERHFIQEEQSGKSWLEIIQQKIDIDEKKLILQVEGNFDKAKYVQNNDSLVDFFTQSNSTHILVSNSPAKTAYAVLEKIGLRNYKSIFSHIITIEQMAKIKPDSELFNHIAGLVQLPHSSLLMIGDSQVNDIRPAQEVGVRTCHVNNWGESSSADFSFGSIDELLKHLRKGVFTYFR